MAIMIALFVIGLVGIAAGAVGNVIKTVGDVHQVKGQAEADRLKAEQAKIESDAAALQAQGLDELADTGGYYDQVQAALQLQLDDIAADRAASAVALELQKAELAGAQAQSKLEEETAVANLEGQIEVSKVQEKSAVAGRVVEGLEVAGQGAQAVGGIRARAGAGNVTGASILKQAESVMRQVGRRVSLVNLQSAAMKVAGTAERAAAAAQIGVVRGAADLEQLRLTNEATRAQLQYEDVLRGLDVNQQQTIANQTQSVFQQKEAMGQAGIVRRRGQLAGKASTAYTNEADWLSTTGVALAWTGGLANTIGQAAIGISQLKFPGGGGSGVGASGPYGGGSYTHAGPANPGLGY